jgi:lipase
MSLPETLSDPHLHHVKANGISLAYFEWGAHLRGIEATLVMVHATGFHGRVWDQIVAHFPDRHVIALEQRGHGRSENAQFEGWAIFGRDLAAFVVALDLEGVIGIGHSMGAHALVQAAAFEPSRFARLILIDPVIVDPLRYHLAPTPEGTMHPASKRLKQFESSQAMFERFADRPPYSGFTEQALRDYCNHALKPSAQGGGYELACSPMTEAKIYLTAVRNAGVFASVLALKIPVLLIRARLPKNEGKPDFSGSPTWPGLVSIFHNAREVYLPDRSHLAPMEDPAGIAELILEELVADSKVHPT